jgi:hypothetical protein
LKKTPPVISDARAWPEVAAWLRRALLKIRKPSSKFESGHLKRKRPKAEGSKQKQCA